MEAERKSEIMAIFNKYKNTLDDLIDSLDIEFLDHPDFINRPRFIDKRSDNMPKSRGNLPTFLDEDYLNKNVPIMLLEPAPKI